MFGTDRWSRGIKSMKIKQKIIFYNGISLLTLAAVLFLFTFFDTKYTASVLQTMNSEALLHQAQNSLREHVELAYGITLNNYNTFSLSEKERKERAVEELSNLSFDDGTGYFFAYEKRDDGYYFAVHGAKPELVGAKVNLEEKDLYGKEYRKDLIENAGNPGKMVSYYYKKPGTDIVQKKISYAFPFEKWNWFIVCGIYTDEIETAIADQNRQMNSQLRRIAVGMGVLAICGLVLGLILSEKMGRRILRPVIDITSIMEEINRGKGNLTASIEIKSNDETAALARNFNEFISGIRTIITEIIGTSRVLKEESSGMKSIAESFSEITTEQSSATEEVTSSAEEISAGIDLISQNTETQSQEMSAIRLQTEEFSAKLKELSDSMDQTKKMSEQLNTNAEHGAGSLDQINVIIGELNENSQRMNEIVQIIMDISDKINLLALNAAIESARAGDAGRGFAVVADEITKLADETSGSIKNIEALIANNTSRIGKATESISATNTQFKTIGNGTRELRELTEAASIIMREQIEITLQVSSSIRSIAERSTEIRTATNEHKIAMNEIARATSDIAVKTGTIAEHSDRLSEAASRIDETAEGLSSRTGSFTV